MKNRKTPRTENVSKILILSGFKHTSIESCSLQCYETVDSQFSSEFSNFTRSFVTGYRILLDKMADHVSSASSPAKRHILTHNFLK